MKIAVASGKGGTGKTTIATSFVFALRSTYDVVYADLDVEEPDGHIFINPHIKKEELITTLVPRIVEEKCTYCGICQKVCAFNAIFVFKNTRKISVLDELCKGCGNCMYNCPESAIYEIPRAIGVLRYGERDDIEFYEGRLNIGEIMTTTAISYVKEKIDKHIEGDTVVVFDSPPGTSCPMVESVKDADFVILVTEPTPFGLFDLQMAHGVIKKLQKPYGIIVNKYESGFKEMEEFFDRENIPVLLKIPFERSIAEGYSRGITLSLQDNSWNEKFKELFYRIKEQIQ